MAKPTVEFRIDGHVLAQLFGLKAESVHLVGTLSGFPYVKIRCEVPRGYEAGDRLVGKVTQLPNGSVILGVTKA